MRAATRWRRLVTARLAEFEAMGQGAIGRDFWDSRADRFATRTFGTAARDPLWSRLRRGVTPESHVIDIGCGPGRFSLAVAPFVARVTAVDLSPVMLSLLRRQARSLGLHNIRTMAGRWEDADVAPADLLLCSYVLPVVADAEGFLQRMEAARKPQGVAFVYMNAMSGDAVTEPLWRYFHGRPRRQGPTFLDLVEMLRDMGLDAGFEVVEVDTLPRFATVAEAADHYREILLVPDDPGTRAELEGLLAEWLTGRRGSLRPPLAATPAAIVRWPRSRRGSCDVGTVPSG